MLKKWCELSSQRDGTCVKWKIIFRQKNSFGQIAENNDGYDEIPGKKTKNSENFIFDSRIFSDVKLPDFFAQNLLPLGRGQDQVEGSRRGKFLKFFQKTNKRLKYL